MILVTTKKFMAGMSYLKPFVYGAVMDHIGEPMGGGVFIVYFQLSAIFVLSPCP